MLSLYAGTFFPNTSWAQYCALGSKAVSFGILYWTLGVLGLGPNKSRTKISEFLGSQLMTGVGFIVLLVLGLGNELLNNFILSVEVMGLVILCEEQSYKSAAAHDSEKAKEERIPPKMESQIRSRPHRKRGFSMDEEAKWLDSIDYGYFILRKNRTEAFVNRKGREMLGEYRTSFLDFAGCLSEPEEPNRNLRKVIEKMLLEASKGESAKLHVKYSTDNDVSSKNFKQDLFQFYKAELWKLEHRHILIILKEKNESGNTVFSNRLNRAITCTISHELKTLLNGIIGNLELLEESIDKPNKMYYRVALSSSQIFTNRLDDLLDYLQLQNKELKIHYSSFSIDKLIKELIYIFKWQVKQKQMNFMVTKGINVPSTMIGDRARIMQVLINILTKAIDFSDYGTINLFINLSLEHHICFEVTSQGTGMHNRLLSHCISPSKRKKKYSSDIGSEIGVMENMEEMYLEISQQICKEMGTKITLECDEYGVSSIKFSIFDGFPRAFRKRQYSGLHVRRYSNNHENKKNKYLFERTQYKGDPFETVVKCIINVNVSGQNTPVKKPSVKSGFRIQRLDSQSEYGDIGEEPSVDSEKKLSPYIIHPKMIMSMSFKDKMPGEVLNQSIEIRERPQPCQNEEKHLHTGIKLPEEESQSSLQRFPEPQKILNLLQHFSPRRKIRRGTSAEIKFHKFSAFRKKDTVEASDICSVLIVDDNNTNRFVLKALLKKQGFLSIEATDGKEAVNLIEKYLRSSTINELKLIFMDLQMPVMNGIEATKRIIDLCRNSGFNAPPIIGISADPSEDDRLRFLRAGLVEFMSRPINKEKVQEAICKYIKKRV